VRTICDNEKLQRSLQHVIGAGFQTYANCSTPIANGLRRRRQKESDHFASSEKPASNDYIASNNALINMHEINK
jgi:hypothetical protein